ncbi:MAG TPA: tetratricopeptide repeat protein [Verrucomicrobiae bacterium]|nr:tetratricopeptide repeat protein [Verrucomicrobiae bacterium]
MSSKPIASDFTRTKLPWIAAGSLFLIYLFTINTWVSIRSLGVVSKITGWDWSLPTQFPLFYTLTFPVRILPVQWQPLALNLFSALCAAGAIWMLVRTVTLLPHDRTDEQRVRMRHSDGLLGTKFGWAPAALAAAALGLGLTMWEHATAATNEALDLFVFAYLIRCLLEYRQSKNERWLFKLALVYGLGVTNNWALIGYFPLFLGAVIWMRGKAFLNVRFIVMMTALGLVGMLMYLVLPAVWAIKGGGEVTFWDSLKSMLVAQKAMLLNIPELRVRALILSLVSIVPVIIMAIKFPAGFGDWSGPGSTITSFMFRLVHFVFAVACVWVAFDYLLSPREIMVKMPAWLRATVPFLTFYYLAALAAGYYVGYLLLVTSDPPKRHWRPSSAIGKLISPLVHGLAWLAVIAVPVILLVKNFKPAYSQNGKLLTQFTEAIANQLPEKPAILLSEDATELALLDAWMDRNRKPRLHILVNTRALPFPQYHRSLVKRYGDRWPAGGAKEDPNIRIDSVAIVSALNSMSTSNTIYYLHPSFAYFFELFYTEPHGFVSELKRYSTNMIYPPRLTAEQLKANANFWKEQEGLVGRVESLARRRLSDSSYVGKYLSRAVNTWGVDLQKANNFTEAAKYFELALNLNTNNLPAEHNLDFNRQRAIAATNDAPRHKSEKDFLGPFRSWDQALTENGPFDVPEALFAQGHQFLQQYLVRQACDLFKRSSELAPTNANPKISLASALIHGKWLDEAHGVVKELQAATNLTTRGQKLELISMEAAVYFGRQETNRAEAALRDAMEKYPNERSFYDSLTELYTASGQWDKALDLMGRLVSMMPTNTAMRMQRADVALVAGNTNMALADLEQVLKVDPTHVDALLFRSFIAIQQKDYTNATKMVDAILERNDRNPQALTYKGIIHMETREDQKAIDAFTKALKIEPNNVSAIRNRAIVNLRSGKLNESKDDYEMLLKAYPKSYQFYWGLGEIALKKNDKDEALKNYELYLKYCPTNAIGEAADERKAVEAKVQELQKK